MRLSSSTSSTAVLMIPCCQEQGASRHYLGAGNCLSSPAVLFFDLSYADPARSTSRMDSPKSLALFVAHTHTHRDRHADPARSTYQVLSRQLSIYMSGSLTYLSLSHGHKTTSQIPYLSTHVCPGTHLCLPLPLRQWSTYELCRPKKKESQDMYSWLLTSWSPAEFRSWEW